VILQTCGSRSAHSFGEAGCAPVDFMLLISLDLEIPLNVAILKDSMKPHLLRFQYLLLASWKSIACLHRIYP
jgi:hypothetical protein